MTVNQFELHADRLSTTDAEGRRVFIHPADVRGRFRVRRTVVQAILIVFFLALPWIKLGGRQALLLDIAHRRFEIFGLSLRAHDAPILVFVFATAAFALFFATAVFGRVWCGWACPQTVFIDGLFRRIERLIDGPALERRRLQQATWSKQKIFKRLSKWSLYFFATLILTHSFLAYFVGTDRLATMIRSSPQENLGNFLVMVGLTAVVLIDFAWFREQFCTIVCPYGRFQSVLLDRHSKVVAYDRARGEPRSTPQAKVLAKTHGTPLGDCVNCYRCVQVCPTGIDIRRGLQLECVACTSCIDACDEVMQKLNKPIGLIRYQSGLFARTTRFRLNARAAIYLGLLVVSIGALSLTLTLRSPIQVEVLRAKDAPYTAELRADGSTIVINHFKLELSNQSGASQALDFRLNENLTSQGAELVTAIRPLVLLDGNVTQVDVFIRFPKTLLKNGMARIEFTVATTGSENAAAVEIKKEASLVGPFS